MIIFTLFTLTSTLTSALTFTLTHKDRETGEPLTPRDENGEPFVTEIKCPARYENEPMKTMQKAVPSNNTLRFFDERGLKVAKLVTPHVVQVC